MGLIGPSKELVSSFTVSLGTFPVLLPYPRSFRFRKTPISCFSFFLVAPKIDIYPLLLVYTADLVP